MARRKNITEAELLEIGYVREDRMRDCKARAGFTYLHTDRYGLYRSITGKLLKTCIYEKDRFYEEERMIDIAENMAESLSVDVNAIALRKEVGNECEECKVFVTVSNSGC